MNFKAQQLLLSISQSLKKEREMFSKKEIENKISEIKHLTSQKKVPKLTLRKEIIHLENKLKGIYELEKKLLQIKKKESVTITSLKRQNTILKKKLAANKDQNLQRKVNKLSHLLSECLAKHNVKNDVELHKKVAMEIKQNQIKKMPVSQHESPSQLQVLQHKLDVLKKELSKHTGSEKAKVLEQYIIALEGKIKTFGQPIKHRMLFDEPTRQLFVKEKKEDKVLERELPLPPPPK
jgi:hypothetical protein